MIRYREYLPHAGLSAYVACLWTSKVDMQAGRCTHHVLPDNCVDILWQDQAARSFVVGMMTSSLHVHTQTRLQTIAVRFKPGGAAHFFGVPLSELTDRHISLEDLWGSDVAEKLSDSLWSRPMTDRERLMGLERHLLQHLRRRKTAGSSRLVSTAVSAIESSNGLLKIEALSASLGVSRQYLATQFHHHVGLSPKMLARICRFQHTISDIRHGAPGKIDWAELAANHGYYDQSHLIHEIHEFSDGTPEQLAAELHR